jgi:flagellar motor switch protein FliG
VNVSASVPRRDLALSLKRSVDAVKAKVLENVSKRARQSLLEDLELLGRVKLSEVKEAQSVVIEMARHLEADGEIINTGPLSKEVYVV